VLLGPLVTAAQPPYRQHQPRPHDQIDPDVREKDRPSRR
jgi:hypothetical protein